MASLSKDRRGNPVIQFNINPGEPRKTIRLGGVSMSKARKFCDHVEELVGAKRMGQAPEPSTARWVGDLPDDTHRRLAAVGLVQPRARAAGLTLAAFLDGYIAERSDVKSGTTTVYRHTRRCLVGYFGARKPLASITPGDADDWRRWLAKPKDAKHPQQGGQGLSENTVRRRCGIARQFFGDAVRRRLIDENPFADMKGVSPTANRSRDYFITREEADKVLAACPDAQWQLLFALSRYGGLRCPSEHLALTWGDVQWDADRVVVRSPKTEHHEGKASRIIPLFPELRPYLQAVYGEFLEDFDPKERPLSKEPVITRYRNTNANLRTQLVRIIEAAGLKPWPKLFQNLRATRATELVDMPGVGQKAAAEWIGHSVAVADKHYWQVTDDHFAAALQNALQHTTESPRTDSQEQQGNAGNAGVCDVLPLGAMEGVGDTGLEPVTSTL